MIFYHGTNQQFDSFDPARFGSGDGQENGNLGIWVSLTPCLPMRFGKDILVLETSKTNILEVPHLYLKKLEQNLFFNKETNGTDFYRAQALEWHQQGVDIVAVTEFDETIGNLIILDPANARILERVPASDVDRLTELEEEHQNEQLNSRRSNLVDSLLGGRKRNFRI